MKREFTFDSIENMAKNIHLFDEVFGIIKSNHTKNQQMSQLKQLGLFGGNFNLGALGGANKEVQNEKPACFKYFEVLNQRTFEPSDA